MWIARSTSLLLFLSVALVAVEARDSKIKIQVFYVDKGKKTPLAGAAVQCYDEDFPDKDDVMTRKVYTDENGWAHLTYEHKKDSTLWNPTRGWDNFPGRSDPDIYCKVTKESNLRSKKAYLTAYTDTKHNFDQDKTAYFKNVMMYPDRVKRGDDGAYNGCGASSFPKMFTSLTDTVTGIKTSCNNHDLCYENCDETQSTCDIEFREVGYSICNDMHDTGAQHTSCKLAVKAMYELLKQFGSAAYDQEAKDKRCNTK